MKQDSSSGNFLTTSILIIVSQFLERAGYYGIRALIVLYMISGTIGMETDEALRTYAFMGGILIFGKLIGGLIGDFLSGSKNGAILGGIFQTLAAISFCVPSVTTIYLGIGLLSIGSGFYTPNSFALLAKNLKDKESLMDGYFTLSYAALNVGAFIGIMIIGPFAEGNFTYGFALGALFMLLSIIPLFFFSTTNQTSINQGPKKPLTTRIALIAGVSAISALFWMSYEFGAEDMFYSVSKIIAQSNGDISLSLVTGINSSSTMILAVVLGILWLFFRKYRLLKIGFGLFIGALAFGIFLVTYSKMNISFYIISIALLGLAEILIAPTLLSVIAKYTKAKYLGSIYALFGVPVFLINLATGYINSELYDSERFGLAIALVVLALLSLIIVGLTLGLRKNIPKDNN